MINEIKRCGFVSIFGAPNAGKSTLLNNILNDKLSIISPKAQTTRVAIKGILNDKNIQIVFVDTPGILKPKTFLDKNMMRSILHNKDTADINIIICDVRGHHRFINNKSIQKLMLNMSKKFLVINKIDLLERSKLLVVSEELNRAFQFDQTFMISAKRKKGIDKLVSTIKKNIPIRKWVYKDSENTDQKIDFILSEITREKLFQLLNKELPYNTKLKTKIVDKNSFFKVYQSIIINKNSQKPIIIGKNGEKIKEIGIRARKDMEVRLKKKVYLDILVSIEKKN